MLVQTPVQTEAGEEVRKGDLVTSLQSQEQAPAIHRVLQQAKQGQQAVASLQAFGSDHNPDYTSRPEFRRLTEAAGYKLEVRDEELLAAGVPADTIATLRHGKPSSFESRYHIIYESDPRRPGTIFSYDPSKLVRAPNFKIADGALPASSPEYPPSDPYSYFERCRSLDREQLTEVFVTQPAAALKDANSELQKAHEELVRPGKRDAYTYEELSRRKKVWLDEVSGLEGTQPALLAQHRILLDLLDRNPAPPRARKSP